MSDQILRAGQLVQLQDQRARATYSLKVDKVLGDGGQGEVARVRTSKGNTFALKWYKPGPPATPQQLENLRQLAVTGPPHPDLFLWPVAVGTAPGVPAFGYLMKYKDDRFREAKDYFEGKFTIRRRQIAAVLAQIAHGLCLVHQKGMCYCDVSPGNVALDPETGEVRLLDNDNVKFNTPGSFQNSLGSPGFQAPEVVRGQDPTTEHDRFGMAVLFFLFLIQMHPLEGRLLDDIPGWDDTKDAQIYGAPAAFVFHPSDKSNAVNGPLAAKRTARWVGLPRFIRDKFVKAFVDHANRPRDRETTMSWRREMAHLHDSVVVCPKCGTELYADPAEAKDGVAGICPDADCRRPVPLPPRLKLTRYGVPQLIPVTSTTRLYAAHLYDDGQWDLVTPLAEIVPHPTAAGVFGLRNKTQKPWTGSTPDGRYFDAVPGKSVAIKHGMKVKFNNDVQGEFLLS